MERRGALHVRIRNIRPEFTKHEGLADLSREHRLFFIYTWMLADSEGRFEDRPRRIKVELYPYDDDITAEDIDRLLGDLEAKGFIHRYEVGGERFVWIKNFRKHQKLSTYEKNQASELPAPPALQQHVGSTSEVKQNNVSSSSVVAQGAEITQRQKHFRSTTEARPPDDGLLTTDDGLLTTDEKETPSESAAADPDPEPAIQPAELQALWNKSAHPDLPRWRDLTKKRQALARARLRERSIDGPGGWREVVARISASSFCRGANNRAWRASPDWLLQPDTATKVLEGKYDDRKPAQSQSPRTPPGREPVSDVYRRLV